MSHQHRRNPSDWEHCATCGDALPDGFPTPDDQQARRPSTAAAGETPRTDAAWQAVLDRAEASAKADPFKPIKDWLLEAFGPLINDHRQLERELAQEKKYHADWHAQAVENAARLSAIAPHSFDPKRDVACSKGEYASLVYNSRRYEWLRDNMRRMPLGEAGTRYFFDQPSTMSFQEAVDVAARASPVFCMTNESAIVRWCAKIGSTCNGINGTASCGQCASAKPAVWRDGAWRPE